MFPQEESFSDSGKFTDNDLCSAVEIGIPTVRQ